MDGNTSLKYLQSYIKSKDHHPERIKDYFLKLSEEVGELSRAIRKGLVRNDGGEVKNTIDEELWDVIYYTIALANCYDIDLEQVIREKEAINNEKYNSGITFEIDR